jgi:hypothetical protein
VDLAAGCRQIRPYLLHGSLAVSPEATTDAGVERVEPRQRFLLGFTAQFPAQQRASRRHAARGYEALRPRLPFRCGAFPAQAARPLLLETRLKHSPLAPRELPRFSATMGCSDSLPDSERSMDFPLPCPPTASLATRAPERVSRCSGISLDARLPQSPRPVPPLLVSVASGQVSGFGISGSLTTGACVTKPNRGHPCGISGSRLRRPGEPAPLSPSPLGRPDRLVSRGRLPCPTVWKGARHG